MSFFGKLGWDSKKYVRILNRDPCSYCLKIPTSQQPSTVDHIVQKHHKNRPFTNHWTNFTAACRVCNGTLRRDMPLLPFLVQVRRSLDSTHDHDRRIVVGR